MNLLADISIRWPISIGEWAVLIIVVAAIVAVVVVALQKFGITIPDWVQRIFWILLVAFVCVAAVRLLMRM